MHSFICISCMLIIKLTISIPLSERQRFVDTSHSRILEETKSIERGDMVLGLFLDSMTMEFSNQVVIDKQAEDSLKKDNKHKVVAGILPLLPLEKCLPPHQRPDQSDQKLKHKQISQKNKDQEGRRPHNDQISMSYVQLLPILVNDGAIVPKQVVPAKFPYHRKHDSHATCGYHAGYIGHSTESCHVLKTKVKNSSIEICFALHP